MATKAQKVVITIVYEPETGTVVTNGPTSHPDIMMKMLASAMSQVGGVVADMRKALEEKPDITIATPAMSSKLGIKA